MLATIYELNAIQQRAFSEYAKKAIESKGDTANFADIVREIESSLDGVSPSKRSTLEALLNRIEELSEGPFAASENIIPLSEVVKGLVCIDLSKIEKDELRNALAIAILQFIYNTTLMQELAGGRIRKVIMLDEASRTSKSEHSVVVKMLKQLRKYGIAIWFAIQDLSDLATEIKSNYGFMIVHKLDNDEYITRIQKDGNFTKEQASRIKSLAVGQAFVRLNFKDAGVQRPFLVRVQMEDVPELNAKRELPRIQTASETMCIVNHEINARENEDLPSIENGTILNDSAKTEKILPSIEKLDNLSPQQIYAKLSDYAKKLLQAITKEPELNTTEYYTKLGINAYQGNKARAELELHKIIEGKELPKIIGKGRQGRALRLTKIGSKVVNQKNDFRHGGPVHKRMISLIARKCEGHKIEHEYPIGEGKQVDLVIDRRIAIEVETRDFSESNITKNLQAGFEKVIIVCRTEHQAIRFSQQLSKSMPSNMRVKIIDIGSLLGARTLEDVLQ
jgi:hypothetical protein